MEDMYTIKTNRLILREINKEDTATIVNWRSDPQVYQYFKNPHMLTDKEHLYWFQNIYLRDTRTISWIGLTENTPIGVFSIKQVSLEQAEISYLIGRNFQKKGYAKEAVQSIIDWVSLNWKVLFLVAKIHSANIASQHFIETMGFVRVNDRKEKSRYNKPTNPQEHLFICFKKRISHKEIHK